MGLSHFKGQTFIEGITKQETVNWTGINPRHTDHTATAHRRNTLS